eukprot:7298650-Prymnesium_polylepis.1
MKGLRHERGLRELRSGIPNTIFTRTCRVGLILVSGLGTRHTDPSFRWASHDGRISSPQAERARLKMVAS